MLRRALFQLTEFRSTDKIDKVKFCWVSDFRWPLFQITLRSEQLIAHP